MRDDVLIILAAPNVSSQKGGEAIKALQIFRELRKRHPNTIQITHARNREELQASAEANDIFYIEDDFWSIAFWRSRILESCVDWIFSRNAVRLAESLAERLCPGQKVIIHQTEPNSPVVPRAVSSIHLNVFGPINGNLYYPAIYRQEERTLARVRRTLHMPLQRVNRLFRTGIARSNLIFAAGGQRTVDSLLAAGCSQDAIHQTLDCGLPEALLDSQHAEHRRVRGKFVHFGRLVLHKGTWLAIEAVAIASKDVRLDIIGRGPELVRCQELARELHVEDRVRFLDWYANREELFEQLQTYIGMVLPTIEDANGIVVQEAMALGMVPVCLNWGGPSLLIEHGENGFLVETESRESVVRELAEHLDQLTSTPKLAETLSRSAAATAQSWRWSKLIDEWLEQYEKLLS